MVVPSARHVPSLSFFTMQSSREGLSFINCDRAMKQIQTLRLSACWTEHEETRAHKNGETLGRVCLDDEGDDDGRGVG